MCLMGRNPRHWSGAKPENISVSSNYPYVIFRKIERFKM